MLKDLVIETQNTVSLEDHRENLILSKEITMESFMPFLKEFGSRSKEFIRDVVPSLKERNYKEAIKNSKQVKEHFRNLNNIQLSEITIIVPERFDGNIPSFIKDLIIGYDTITEDIKNLLQVTNVELGKCINQSNTGEIGEISSLTLAKDLKLKRENLVKKLSSYFPVNKSTSHSTFIDCFRSSKELIDSYDDLNTLEKTINRLTINDIEKMTEETVMLVDTYLNLVNKNQIPNNKNTKDLIEVLYEVAKDLEFCGYIQSNVIQVYNVYRNMLV